MPFVAADIETIDAAIKSGAVEVQFQDRKIRYNTTSDLIKARTLIYNEVHGSGTAPAVTRQVRIYTTKGL